MLSIKNISEKINIIISDNFIQIKGPLGIIKKKKSKNINIYFNNNIKELILFKNNSLTNHFYIKLIYKLIWGVLKGYNKKLNIIGVGFKVWIDLEQQILFLKIGFSHNITYKIPFGVTITILKKKRITLKIFGIDDQRVKQTAAEIKFLKPIEPYKGKGIKYFGEKIVLKEGKKSNV